MAMVEAPAVAGWPPDDSDGGSDDEVDRRSVTSASTIFCGDSIVSENDPDDMAAVAAANREHAASMGEGDAQPRERIHKRCERPRRDTAPKQTLQQKTTWARRNDADHVGNIGWLFGNWGKRPKKQADAGIFGQSLEEATCHGHWTCRMPGGVRGSPAF